MHARKTSLKVRSRSAQTSSLADGRGREILQFIGAVAADHFQIALGRSLEHTFSVRPDRSFGKCAVNAVELVSFERIHHAFDPRGRQRDDVWKAPHEAYRLVVLH